MDASSVIPDYFSKLLQAFFFHSKSITLAWLCITAIDITWMCHNHQSPLQAPPMLLRPDFPPPNMLQALPLPPLLTPTPLRTLPPPPATFPLLVPSAGVDVAFVCDPKSAGGINGTVIISPAANVAAAAEAAAPGPSAAADPPSPHAAPDSPAPAGSAACVLPERPAGMALSRLGLQLFSVLLHILP